SPSFSGVYAWVGDWTRVSRLASAEKQLTTHDHFANVESADDSDEHGTANDRDPVDPLLPHRAAEFLERGVFRSADDVPGHDQPHCRRAVVARIETNESGAEQRSNVRSLTRPGFTPASAEDDVVLGDDPDQVSLPVNHRSAGDSALPEQVAQILDPALRG